MDVKFSDVRKEQSSLSQDLFTFRTRENEEIEKVRQSESEKQIETGKKWKREGDGNTDGNEESEIYGGEREK